MREDWALHVVPSRRLMQDAVTCFEVCLVDAVTQLEG